MQKIAIHPSWQFVGADGERLDARLFTVLRAIRDEGKLTDAARAAGLSYRHAWDLLGRWNRFFGSPLVAMERGKGTRLSSLGEKLLWAEQRTESSLFPQLANIASELNVEIARRLKPSQAILRVHASHGYAIEKLPALLRAHGHCEMELKYTGSIDALRSLAGGACDMAGFHVPEGTLGRSLWKQYAPWLDAHEHRILPMVLRTQGLIVARGNPLGIRGVRHLARKGARFVNRQKGSGTRLLLDALLKAERVDAGAIRGYAETGEHTHAAVAAFVASGIADAGLGVEPAARQFRLDFVPVARERYLLACRKESLAHPAMAELLAALDGPGFRDAVGGEPGYVLDAPGRVISVSEAFPWARKRAG